MSEPVEGEQSLWDVGRSPRRNRSRRTARLAMLVAGSPAGARVCNAAGIIADTFG